MTTRDNRGRGRGCVNKLDIFRKEMEREKAAQVEAMRREAEEAAQVEAMRREAEEAAQVEAMRREAKEAAQVEAMRRSEEEAAQVQPVQAQLLTEQQQSAIKYMQQMEERGRNRIRPPPPQYKNPSDYSGYEVQRDAKNFPVGHNYTMPMEPRPVIALSPDAQKYVDDEKHNENSEKVGKSMFDYIFGSESEKGGRKKNSSRTRTHTRQKKRQHHHRRKRHFFTKKYRK
jgi:hypothetical protein